MARILVIDDEPVVRSIFRTVLEREGHAVEEAGDGREGLDAYAREPADLVIVDLVMPKTSGVTTIRKLRSAHPEARVIPMTGVLASLCPSDKLAEIFGAARALIKPVTPERLLHAVSAALADGVSA
jgi:CheY-like chemotaxis protein